MTLTIKLDRNWSSFQLANSTPPLSVTGSAIAPSARIEILLCCLSLQSAALGILFFKSKLKCSIARCHYVALSLLLRKAQRRNIMQAPHSYSVVQACLL